MLPHTPPACATVTDALNDLQGKKQTAADLVEACHTRIAAREDAVGAWHVRDDAAVRDAAARPRRGALSGLPVGIKDVIDTADLPTSYGCPAFAAHRPSRDAACVAKLRAAGAIVLGKTVTTEFASMHPGKTRNPHNRNHTPGGSSSGSAAAVADGMVPVALGTQTAGSVIRPAAFCGTVGYKGTYGWSDMTGVHPLADSLDRLGIFTRRVADVAPVRAVLADKPARARSVAKAANFGICRTPLWKSADPATRSLFDTVASKLKTAGVDLREVIVPPQWDELSDAHRLIMLPEMVRIFTPIRAQHERHISASFLEQMKNGEAIDAQSHAAGKELAARCRADLDLLLPPGDVWLVPSAPGEAPMGTATGDPVFNRMWTLLGTPCVTLPFGAGPRGLPLGIQLVASPGCDDDLLDAALWLEQALA